MLELLDQQIPDPDLCFAGSDFLIAGKALSSPLPLETAVLAFASASWP